MDNQICADSLLKSTLSAFGVPVERVRYTDKAEEYITFQTLSGNGAAHADDDETAYEHFYRVDIFSKGDYTALLKQVKQGLKAAGFYGISVGAEMYENDTGFYHVPLDFYFMEV